MTQDDLDELHEIWRKRLRMTHWEGSMALCNRVNKRGALGECSVDYGRNSYSIRILDPQFALTEADKDVETTVVHELLHARRWWEFNEQNAAQSGLFEREVDENSLMLVEAWRATE